MDNIYANIATIPEREHLLKQVVESIAPQVDRICISLNNYSNGLNWVDKFRHKIMIWQALRQNQMGDGEKFLKVSEQSGYIFTMDDDLVYPADYVQTMINHIERYQRKAVITLHGRNFHRPPGKVRSYYREPKRTVYRCLGNVTKDVKVDVGGTGVMAWHSDTLKVSYDRINLANCADVWLSIFAKEQNVPIYCVKHSEDYLKYIGPDDDSFETPKTIWAKHFNNDKEITDLYNKYHGY